jgi:SAM-dependent methyltransferase
VGERDLRNSDSGRSYPIIRGIPRFVGAENYSDDFGAQWNRFPMTQLDSFTGLDISESRLARCLRGNLTNLKGKKVLEAGSGAGRFTEILLKYGAIVHSFDFSNAVEANAKNNGDHENLVLVQADIREIPFPKASYDYVICLGVLQHTPDPEESIQSIWQMIKPGGALVIDHYQWKWRIVLPPPIGQALDLYRLWILRLPKEKRFSTVKKLTDYWFPWHWRYRDSWLVTRILRRVSPVIFHYPHIKLNDKQQYYDWSLLDTHDSTTDFYKHYRTPVQIRIYLEEIGATDIVVQIGGNGVEAFCRK